MRTIRLVATWIVQVFAGALFVLLGTGKFMDASWARSFARWGYPDGFYMVVGVLETLGGLALLVPATASYGGVLLGAILLGAAGTHAVFGETHRLPVPLVYLGIVLAIAWARRASAWRPTGREARGPASARWWYKQRAWPGC